MRYIKWSRYIEEPTRNKLEKLLSDLRKEMASLKWGQEFRIPMVKKDFLMNCISHLKTFFMPAIISIIALFILVLLIISYFVSADKQISVYGKLIFFDSGMGF
jgi:hypothetical protein